MVLKRAPLGYNRKALSEKKKATKQAVKCRGKF
jgi:hypothetical protein